MQPWDHTAPIGPMPAEEGTLEVGYYGLLRASHLAYLSQVQALEAMQPWRLVGARSRAVLVPWSLCVHAPRRRGWQRMVPVRHVAA